MKTSDEETLRKFENTNSIDDSVERKGSIRKTTGQTSSKQVDGDKLLDVNTAMDVIDDEDSMVKFERDEALAQELVQDGSNPTGSPCINESSESNPES